MQFKSLAIQGFKSFADKTLIEFPNGITAIVGPNGSGKSNIMDALRWVFGEQRASELRGDDMGDVIFSGSVSRRSAGYAQVTLMLEDISPEISGKWGSMSELSVTRRIYRAGEREYLINGRKARLKDIRDIFFDTGLGSRSISIIEQERVTKIVNSTPYELRYFLEETAGLVRYKERKKEAEARLKQTKENLARISDIISLLAADIEHLAKQAEELNEYRRLRKIKNNLEKSSIAAAYALLLKEEKTHKSEVENYRAEVIRLTSVHSEKVNEEVRIMRVQEELRGEIKTIRDRHDAAKTSLAKVESDIRHMQTGMETAEQQKVRLESDIKSAEAREGELNSRLDTLKESIADIGELVDEFTETLAECRHELAHYRSALSQLADGKREMDRVYLALSQKLSECSNRLNLKQAENLSLASNMERLNRERDGLLAESATLGERLNAAVTGSKDTEAAISYLEGEVDDALTAYRSKAADCANRQKICDNINTSIKIAEDRLSFLEQEIASKTVGGEAGRQVLEKFGGKRYTDLFPSEKNYLLYGDLLVFDGSVREALLAYAEQIDISFRFVFDAYIPKSSELMEKISEGLYLKDGIYIKAGADNEGIALMQLKERLEAEEQKLAALSQSFGEEAEAFEMMKLAAEELSNAYNDRNEQLKSKKLDYSNMLTNIAHFDEQSKRILKNISVVEKEMDIALSGAKDMENDILQLKQIHEKLLSEQESMNEEREILEEKVEQIETLLEEKRDDEAHASRELTRYTERKAAAETEEKQLRENLADTEKALKTLSDRIREVSYVFTEEWQDKFEVLWALKDECTRNALELSEKLFQKERQQPEYETTLGEIRRELAHVSALLHEHDKKTAHHEGKIETVTAGIEALANEMREHFSEELADVWENYMTGRGEQKKIAADIASVSTAIEAMGALNMAAEEEFALKSGQHDEQLRQMHDVENAIESLTQLISEIDDSTVALFEETFNAVRKNFTDVFNRFFGSGSADLCLTEPEDMLNTGVELSFNPPGKRISNKNLLSGGEKALAALTLLFALFLQKPTPFCFLDEVDAPLDDRNAGKFIAMLQMLSHDTQFVVITHKHLTMAAADSLYGITMQEGGVSTLLSVEMNTRDAQLPS